MRIRLRAHFAISPRAAMGIILPARGGMRARVWAVPTEQSCFRLCRACEPGSFDFNRPRLVFPMVSVAAGWRATTLFWFSGPYERAHDLAVELWCDDVYVDVVI